MSSSKWQKQKNIILIKIRTTIKPLSLKAPCEKYPLKLAPHSYSKFTSTQFRSCNCRHLILFNIEYLGVRLRAWFKARYPDIFTARKRSLGQGNIFAPVCHSVHRGVCSVHAGRPPLPGGDPLVGDPRGGTPPSRRPPWGVTPPPHAEHAGRHGQGAGGTHPTGIAILLSIYWGPTNCGAFL